MKLSFHRESFASAFGACVPLTKNRDVKQILRMVKCVAEDGKVTLSATDLEIGVMAVCRNVKVEEPGACLLSAETVGPILREATDEDLDLDADASAIKLTGHDMQFELPVEDPGAFPDVPPWDGQSFSVPGEQFREAVRRVVFACSSQKVASKTSNRYGATLGVGFDVQDGRLVMVGTDGNREAVCQLDSAGETPNGVYSIPPKAIQIVCGLESDCPVEIVLRLNEALFRVGESVVYSRLMEGRFPDWRRAIPSPKTRFTMPARDLAHVLKIASLASDVEDDGKLIGRRVELHLGGGKVIAKAQDASTGKAEAQRPCPYDGKPMVISITPAYLLQFLRVLDEGQEIEVGLTKPDSSILFRVGESYQYVATPLHNTKE